MTNRIVILLTIVFIAIAYYAELFRTTNSDDLFFQLGTGHFNLQGIGAIALLMALSGIGFLIKEKLPAYAKAILEIVLPVFFLWIAARAYWRWPGY